MLKVATETVIATNFTQDDADYQPPNPVEFEDIFAALMRLIFREGAVSTRSVFAARVLMDILEISGDAYKGRDMLVYQAEMSDNAIKCMTEDANTEIPSDECKLINSIATRVNKHMGNPVYPQLRHARMNFDKCIESFDGPAKEKKAMMEITGRMSILNLNKAIQESNGEIILPEKTTTIFTPTTIHYTRVP